MTSVLIVEDQRMPRENMEHLVEDSGRYRRVASLSTAEMALAQCARHAVDLVLMDVCTKGSRDGIDVAAEIKARYPVWGDRIFEKCGIGRDEGGDGGKTLEIRGKRRLSARDGGANYQQS